MGCVLGLATWLVWGPIGLAIAIFAIGAMLSLAPRVPASAIMKLYQGTLVTPDNSQLSSLVDVLAWRAQVAQRPALYVIPSMTLNAFATGTSESAAIAVTEGLLRRLTLREIAGVLAHEMSHVRNNDVWVMGLADLITRFLQIMSYLALGLAIFNIVATFTQDETIPWPAILVLYLAPALSSGLQLGLSRAREFDADADAARLTGDPLGLASALRRLETSTGRFWEDLMFPVPARRVPLPSLLRTHPDTEDRIRRLLALSGEHAHEPIVIVEQPMVSLVGYGPGDMRPRYRWPGLWY